MTILNDRPLKFTKFLQPFRDEVNKPRHFTVSCECCGGEIHEVRLLDLGEEFEQNVLSAIGSSWFSIWVCARCSDFTISKRGKSFFAFTSWWRQFCWGCKRFGREVSAEIVRRPTAIRPGKLCVYQACSNCDTEKCFTVYIPLTDISQEDLLAVPNIENQGLSPKRALNHRRDPHAAAFSARFSQVLVVSLEEADEEESKEANS